ncbi:MAG: triose-phosphate isomerase [Rhodobacterales bacterium]|nr:MAG: triose-phosphate isomerase [Rhodobacterales bacterium]
MRKLAAGNWKMNGGAAALAELEAIAAHEARSEVLICPPATLISRAAAVAGPVAIGGQDCHAQAAGAHTGDVAAGMLLDAGARYVILGHSERRADHGESDADVAAKVAAAQGAGLDVVLCLGESLAQREAGQTLDVIGTSLVGSLPDGVDPARLVIAYEPIWAIGTGKIPTLAEIGAVHDFLRAELVARFGAAGEAIRLLYGGSVKPSNAAEIFAIANVDGALVGGASLQAADFIQIVDALDAA